MEEKQGPVTPSPKKLACATATAEITADLTKMVTDNEADTALEGEISPSKEDHRPKPVSDGEEIGEDSGGETQVVMVCKFSFAWEADQPECALPPPGIQPGRRVIMCRENDMYCVQISLVQADPPLTHA